MKDTIRKKWLRVIEVFKQPSTWRGLVVVVTGAGVALRPEHSEAITAGGLILAGMIGIVLEQT
jgi:hypothetical protein